MRIGNDVVDLDDPATARSHLSDRFLARVCTVDERTAIAASLDPRTRLWSLFAAKEAAYKVAAKLGPAPGFAHRRFEVAADLRAVRFGDLLMDLDVDLDIGAGAGEEGAAGGRVHAVASTRSDGGAPIVLRGVARLSDGQDESLAARDALRAAVGGYLGCALDSLEVVRDPAPGSWDGFAPPRMLREGQLIPGLDVSLSHDGRYVAYAAVQI